MGRTATTRGRIIAALILPLALPLVRGLASTAAAQPLVLNGRLIDGTGAAPVEKGRVVVSDGRIACAGPVAACPVPAGTKVINRLSDDNPLKARLTERTKAPAAEAAPDPAPVPDPAATAVPTARAPGAASGATGPRVAR